MVVMCGGDVFSDEVFGGDVFGGDVFDDVRARQLLYFCIPTKILCLCAELGIRKYNHAIYERVA